MMPTCCAPAARRGCSTTCTPLDVGDLREFTFGHANRLAAVARAHLVALAQRTPLLPGSEQRVFLDIDSLLRPVYGHHKQGASFGHAKIASRALLRLGLP